MTNNLSQGVLVIGYFAKVKARFVTDKASATTEITNAKVDIFIVVPPLFNIFQFFFEFFYVLSLKSADIFA